jgi:hypothetical protein
MCSLLLQQLSDESTYFFKLPGDFAFSSSNSSVSELMGTPLVSYVPSLRELTSTTDRWPSYPSSSPLVIKPLY